MDPAYLFSSLRCFQCILHPPRELPQSAGSGGLIAQDHARLGGWEKKETLDPDAKQLQVAENK